MSSYRLFSTQTNQEKHFLKEQIPDNKIEKKINYCVDLLELKLPFLPWSLFTFTQRKPWQSPLYEPQMWTLLFYKDTNNQ